MVPFIEHINKNNINIKVFLLLGSEPGRKRKCNLKKENMIITDTEENFIPGILKKTIKGFEYVNERYEYKHILRTNLSSFFIIDKLIDLNNKLPTAKIYYGCGRKRLHCGAAIWFSRDIIENIILNQDKLDYRLIDDWAIFEYIKNTEFYFKPGHTWKKITKTPRYDIIGWRILWRKDVFNKVINNIKKGNHYHIRVVFNKDKSESNRLKDAEVTKKLTEYFYNV